ncbi:amidohydrolase family protein [Variovorax sp. PCZ-1]|uniref:amidohydrolase family protein n=1 Tax=Variovorax sp. PCZ-1 TaxID=2835533 RepID=UPI001BCF9C89|nr:amidohydrolase family protein [Variovorax sp. PCZ-1]MBS7806540.1 amidohydrolase family protein [Variovorax sp. PCZ-1]
MSIIKSIQIPQCVRGFESGSDSFDIYIEKGHIAGIEPAQAAINSGVSQKQMLLPAFVDLHLHIDKTFVVDEVGAAEGDLFAAIDRMAQHRDGWSAEHIETRMERALQEAYVNGCRALRTHLDWMTKDAPKSLAVFEKLRDAWRGKLTLQCVSLTPLDFFDDTFNGEDLALEVATANLTCDQKRGEAALLGAFVYRNERIYDKLQRVFDLAIKNQLNLDFHVDEGLDVDARGLKAIAELTIKNNYQGRVTCGHACSLAMQSDEDALATLKLCFQAGIHLVALPTTNLYLQGAWNRTPIERGITRLREAREAGVNCSIATDNVADGFYPYGSYNPLASYALGVQMGHLSNPLDWLSSITSAPSKAMNLPWDGLIREGCSVNDLLLVQAGDARDLMNAPLLQRLSTI